MMAVDSLREQNVYMQKDQKELDLYNPMIPLSENDYARDLLARDGHFMILGVLSLITQSIFWGELGYLTVPASC
jgi:hypothetical protein